MKLTPEQIKQIAQTLDNNGLCYIDLELEVTDHIASAIEIDITNKNISFQESFCKILENWKDDLQPINGFFWVSPNVTAPKIVMTQWIKRSKKMIFEIILFTFLILSLFWIVKLNNHEQLIYEHFNAVKQYSCFALFIALLTSYLLVIQTKVQSTFGYMFKRNFFLVTSQIIIISTSDIRFDHFDFLKITDIVLLFYNIATIIFGIKTIELCLSHFKFISMFSKSS